jgi:hypothetical protein
LLDRKFRPFKPTEPVPKQFLPWYGTRVAALTPWLRDNWFLLVQGIGIFCGLLFTSMSIRRDVKSRRVSNLLDLTKQHRELWNEVHRQPELQRVFDADADLVAKPVSIAEEEFLLVVIVHFSTGWLLAREERLLTLGALAADARWFFSLPLPRFVWAQTKSARDPRFVSFIEHCLKEPRMKIVRKKSGLPA